MTLKFCNYYGYCFGRSNFEDVWVAEAVVRREAIAFDREVPEELDMLPLNESIPYVNIDYVRGKKIGWRWMQTEVCRHGSWGLCRMTQTNSRS